MPRPMASCAYLDFAVTRTSGDSLPVIIVLDVMYVIGMACGHSLSLRESTASVSVEMVTAMAVGLAA